MLKFGSTPIIAKMFGSTPIIRRMLGSTLVWEMPAGGGGGAVPLSLLPTWAWDMDSAAAQLGGFDWTEIGGPAYTSGYGSALISGPTYWNQASLDNAMATIAGSSYSMAIRFRMTSATRAASNGAGGGTIFNTGNGACTITVLDTSVIVTIGGAANILTIPVTVATNAWNTLVWSFDSATSTLTAWLNGVEYSVGSVTTTIGTGTTMLGANRFSAPADVDIDYLYAWEYFTLTAANAEWLYNTGSTRTIADFATSTYALVENFETTTTGYENTWTVTGTVDPVYSTSGLSMEGSQCVRFEGSVANWIEFPAFPAAYSECEIYFKLRFASMPTTARNILTLNDSLGNTLLILYKGTTNACTLRTPTSAPQATIYGMELNTTYHVWLHYKKGTGANAVMSFEFSEDGIRRGSGTKYVILLTGTAAADAAGLEIGMVQTTTADLFIDRILVSEFIIGNNP